MDIYLTVSLNLLPSNESNREPAMKELEGVKIETLDELNSIVREQFDI